MFQPSRLAISIPATLLVLFVTSPRAAAGNAFGGESITHVGDGGHEAWMIGKSQDVGYKYESVAAFWLDLWTWGGTYCVYQRFENKYVPISKADAARLLKKPEAELQPPLSYRYPPGLLVFGPLVLIAAIVSLFKKPDKPADTAKDVAKPAALPLPMDLGKPLEGKHPLGTACPKCGSTEYRSVTPSTMVAFANDRVCLTCSTRYTPPTPAWARFIFGGFGLAAVIAGGAILYHMLATGNMGSGLGPIAPVAVLVVGAACLYKAAAR